MKRITFAFVIAALAGQTASLLRSETTAARVDAASIVLVAPAGTTSADQEILRWQIRVKEDSRRSAYWERLGWGKQGAFSAEFIAYGTALIPPEAH